MSKKPDPLPQFQTEADERAYWESHDSADHVDWSKAEGVRLPNLKPTTIVLDSPSDAHGFQLVNGKFRRHEPLKENDYLRGVCGSSDFTQRTEA